MRALILAAGAALTLSACGGGGEEVTAEENNTMAVETLEVGNVIVNEGDAMNGLDANAMGTNGMMLDTNATDVNMTGEAGANTTTNTL